MMNVLAFPHQVTRLIFDAGQPYEKFRGLYEAVVPPRTRCGAATPDVTRGARPSPQNRTSPAGTVSSCTGART
jgi:hypothetical protein